MPRPSDCIFCGAATGSREHMFPAGLGGRRMNKGILCGPCNEKFSHLDAILVQQLQVINGFIGVRPDRANMPKPARVGTGEDAFLLDRTGRPALAASRVRADEVQPDGQRHVSMEFSNERQVQEWIAEQRAEGIEVTQTSRSEKQRYFHPVHVEWSFGGNDAFREIGRIALNFLAHHLPDVARSVSLRPFKDFVEGNRTLRADEQRHVWYAQEDAWPLPPPVFAFGHQVLLRCDTPTGETYGRVRIFGTFDLFVWFGRLDTVPEVALLVDIDPLAEHPPDDLRTTRLESPLPPPTIVPPITDDSAAHLGQLLGRRVRDLFSRVHARQWKLGTAGLLNEINSTRELPVVDRANRIAQLLAPQDGRVLLLGRHVVEQLKQRGHDSDSAFVASQIEPLLLTDPESLDGLSAVARDALQHARRRLAKRIAEELDTGPIEDARLRLLLEGGPGAFEVGSALAELVLP